MSAGSPQSQPQRVLNVAQIRMVDSIAVREFKMSSLVLMENAGRGCADLIHGLANPSDEMVVLCGPGNNGGDGLVIARHLHARGYRIRLWMVADREKLSPDATANLTIIEHTRIRPNWIGNGQSTHEMEKTWSLFRSDLGSSQMILDALLGTGATGTPRSLMAEAIRLCNQTSVYRIAIDIPTGLDAETGQSADPTFRADATLTLVAEKPGFAKPTAATFLGKIHVLSIGVPPEVFDRL